MVVVQIWAWPIWLRMWRHMTPKGFPLEWCAHAQPKVAQYSPYWGLFTDKTIGPGRPREHPKGTSGHVTSSFRGSPTGDIWWRHFRWKDPNRANIAQLSVAHAHTIPMDVNLTGKDVTGSVLDRKWRKSRSAHTQTVPALFSYYGSSTNLSMTDMAPDVTSRAQTWRSTMTIPCL
jgi:hypothetical protein